VIPQLCVDGRSSHSPPDVESSARSVNEILVMGREVAQVRLGVTDKLMLLLILALLRSGD
jgi:hypothetical protein